MAKERIKRRNTGTINLSLGKKYNPKKYYDEGGVLKSTGYTPPVKVESSALNLGNKVSRNNIPALSGSASKLGSALNGVGSAIGAVGAIAGGVSDIIPSTKANLEMPDTSGIEDSIEQTALNTYEDANTLDALQSSWDSTQFQRSDYSRDNFNGTVGETLGNIGKATLSGFTAGMSTGNPWVALGGAVAGLAASSIGAGVREGRAKRRAEEYNAAAQQANTMAINNFNQQVEEVNADNTKTAMANVAANGGRIYIKPSKRGTFTAAAKKRGKGVQEFARQVLANKENYSPAMVKKANFAHIFGGRKKAEGGFLEDFNFMENPIEDNRTNYVEIKSEPDFSSIKTTRNRAYNKDYISYIYNKLKDSYLGDTQIAAILGSIIEESGGNPFAKSDTGKFQGLLQWEKGRYSPISDDVYEELDNQIQYILRSISNTSDKKSWTHGGDGSGYSSYKEPFDEFFSDKSSISDATRALNLGYVRPHGKHESADNRSSVAEQVYNIINNGKPLNKQAVSALSKAEASNAEFVKRLNDRNRDYIQDWENPNNIATHKLGWGEDDNGAFVYPGVSNTSGELVDYTRIPYSPNTAVDIAFDNDDIIRMSPEEASWFTENYKNYYPKGSRENSFKKGGNLSVHGGDFSNGVTQINNGGTHEQNPLKGVPMGRDEQGIPNLVEEGEVIFDDYVFSNRLAPNKKELTDNNLNGKYNNWSFAKIAEDLSRESSERPNDPISKRGLKDSMNKLMTIQEMQRRRNNNIGENRLMACGGHKFDGKTAILPEITVSARPDKLPRVYDYPTYTIQGIPTRRGLGMLTGVDWGRNPSISTTPKDPIRSGMNKYLQNSNTKGQMNLINRYENDNTDILDEIIEPFAVEDTSLGKLKEKNARREKRQQNWNNFKDSMTGAESLLRYAPAVGSAIGALAGVLTNPDYENAEILKREAANLPSDRVRARTLDNYLTYRPLDRNYYLNQLNAQANATRRAIQNAGGNAGSVMAGLLASGYNTQNAIGNALMQMDMYNEQNRQRVADFNRATDQYNSQALMNTDAQNASLAMDRARLRSSLMDRYANMRELSDSQLEAMRSQNLMDLFNNLGMIGREAMYANTLDNMKESGLFGVLNNSMGSRGTFCKGGKLLTKNRRRR